MPANAVSLDFKAKTKPGRDKDAMAIIKRFDALKAARGTWDTLWQEIADYIQPRKSQITTSKTAGVEGFTDDLYNLTAVRANQILASGQMDYLFSGRWFSFDPLPELEGDDAAKQWYQKATEVSLRELARSNWNLQIHEMLLDRGAFGTATLLGLEGINRALTFHKFDVGDFAICEDYEGEVDTLMREFTLTARQAEQMFGLDALGPIVRRAAMDENKCDMAFKFVHAIYPRKEGSYSAGKVDGMNRPIASCYVSRDDKLIVKEDGFFEKPYAVTRFLRWGKEVYGYSPSIEALPTVRQVNFLEKQWDALTELKAFPRVMVPNNLEGDVDFRSGGITTVDPNAVGGGEIKEWGTLGDDRTLAERVRMKDDAIREAFHVDLFQMLKNIERQMTAFEVQQRLAEKVTAFSPTFYRLQTEVTNPLLLRIFAVLFRQGKFGQPPPSVFVPGKDGQSLELAIPAVTLTSKLAMAIKAAENNAFMQMMEMLLPVLQVQPDVIDNFDLDKASRGISQNLSVPVAWQRPEDERDAMRQQRAEAAAKANAMALAESGAKAAKDATQASPGALRAVMGQAPDAPA